MAKVRLVLEVKPHLLKVRRKENMERAKMGQALVNQ